MRGWKLFVGFVIGSLVFMCVMFGRGSLLSSEDVNECKYACDPHDGLDAVRVPYSENPVCYCNDGHSEMLQDQEDELPQHVANRGTDGV